MANVITLLGNGGVGSTVQLLGLTGSSTVPGGGGSGSGGTSTQEIYLGSNKLSNVYIGSNQVTAVYIGSTKVWEP